MFTFVKTLMTEPTCALNATTSAKLELATLRRFCILYYQLRFQNP